MNSSKVFFSDMRALPGSSLPEKLDKLIRRAGIEELDCKDKFVAIKIHFGEPGNMAYLRAGWAKVVVDRVRAMGGRPFLTDCNTLYTGRRKNALEHLESAYENGYSPFSTGCHVLIADGLRGTDELLVPVPGGELVKEAKIGRAIMDADVVISLNHFKGHEAVGFGGALKNLGMGSGSRAGKMEMHCSGKPVVSNTRCTGCGVCTRQCAHGAIAVGENRKAAVDQDKCVGCGRCLGVCNYDAVYNPNEGAVEELDKKIAEYTKAVVDGRPHFHINIANQISPYCDCHGENDTAIIPDVGMFASFDPVAIDVACADACNAQPVLPGSLLAEQRDKGHTGDHFHATFPITDWRLCTAHAEKLGIGSQQYELITVK